MLSIGINKILLLTSKTVPYEPEPKAFPVGTTLSKKYCCKRASERKFDDKLLLAIPTFTVVYNTTPTYLQSRIHWNKHQSGRRGIT